eukprot:440972-Prymnesium_polylepis.2
MHAANMCSSKPRIGTARPLGLCACAACHEKRAQRSGLLVGVCRGRALTQGGGREGAERAWAAVGSGGQRWAAVGSGGQ